METEKYQKVTVRYPVPDKETAEKVSSLTNAKLDEDSLITHKCVSRVEIVEQFLVVVESGDELLPATARSIRRVIDGISVEVAREVSGSG
jgi:hypothetical protein